MACSSLLSSYLRKPRQVSLVSRSCISIIHHHHHPLITTTRRLSSVRAFSSAASETCNNNNNPWLMLTPEMGPLSSGVFKFYSLAEDKVITIHRKNLKDQLGLGSGQEVELECKGSSHGWLVLFDRCSSDLFLYNPLSARHLKLPTIRNLEAIPKDGLDSGLHCVEKVILSSSDPEGDPNCRAVMMIDGVFGNPLAFCCPSSSSEWIETYQCYEDVVCAGDDPGLFLGVKDHKWPYPEFEGWDLRDLLRPRLISLEDRLHKEYGKTFPWRGYSFKEPAWKGREANFLVPVAAGNNNKMLLFYVCVHRGDWDLNKMDIHVHKFDFEKGELVHMDRSLEGLALFVGRNHSFACLSGDHNVKPDSIYFTHPQDFTFSGGTTLGRNCIEIYNYRDATFSPLFRITKKEYYGMNSPVWYTPTNH